MQQWTCQPQDSQAGLSGARTPLFQEEKGGGEKKKSSFDN